jgi:hypothetical protein
MALVKIGDHHPGEFIILSDSMSSLRALRTRKISPRIHSLVYEIKEASWWLERHGYGIHIMWIPSHVGVMGNERAVLPPRQFRAILSLLLLSNLLISDLCQD